MKKLRDYPWKISYSSNTHNTIADFYIPALECAVQYDRKAGFFSSAILSKVARGLGAMLHSGGRMRLIMGCQFSPQDLQASTVNKPLEYPRFNPRIFPFGRQPSCLLLRSRWRIVSC